MPNYGHLQVRMRRRLSRGKPATPQAYSSRTTGVNETAAGTPRPGDRGRETAAGTRPPATDGWRPPCLSALLACSRRLE